MLNNWPTNYMRKWVYHLVELTSLLFWSCVCWFQCGVIYDRSQCSDGGGVTLKVWRPKKLVRAVCSRLLTTNACLPNRINRRENSVWNSCMCGPSMFHPPLPSSFCLFYHGSTLPSDTHVKTSLRFYVLCGFCACLDTFFCVLNVNETLLKLYWFYFRRIYICFTSFRVKAFLNIWR